MRDAAVGTRLRPARLLGLVLLALACSGGDDNGTGPNENPSIDLSLGAASVDVTQGGSNTFTVNVTRAGGFTDAITLSAEGLPTGVTIANVTVPAAQTSATMTVAAAASAAEASGTVTIRASGTSVTAKTKTITVNVTAPQQQGSFALALNPATLSVQAGANATSTVTVTRTAPFTGAVALTATAPAGITATLDPTSATGGTSTLTVAAATSTAAGNYTVAVKGTGQGVADQTANLTVTVSAAPSGGNVTYTFCAADAPVWVAVQDGTGAWTQVTGNNNQYAFNIASGKGAIAYVTGSATAGYTLQVLYGTTAELQGQGTNVCATGGAGGKTVNVPVTGLQGADIAFVGLGGASGTASAATPTAVLKNVQSGNVDLVAAHATIDLTTFAFNVDKLVVRRNLDPADNSTLPAVDFSASEAFAPVAKNLTINNLGTDQGFVFATYITANGSAVPYFFDAQGSTSGTRTVATFPADKQAAGDLHMVFVTAQPPGENPTSTRTVGNLFAASADQTVTLGPTLTAPTITVLAGTPYVRLRAAYAIQAEYNKFWSVTYTQGTGAALRVANVLMTAGYGGQTGTVNLDIPDFTGVAGWNNDFGLKAGVATDWNFAAESWTQSGGVVGTPFAAGTFFTATRSGTLTP